MTRIITTMTVIPGRELKIIRAIMSIKEGHVKPDAMYVNIPKTYVRFDTPLAPWLKPVLGSLGVIVNELEHDRCCFNKIIPTLEFEKDPETLVVTIDDDVVYSPLFISGLLQGYNIFGDVVGYSGLVYPEKAHLLGINPRVYTVINGHGSQTHILQDGFGTMTKLSTFSDFPNIPPLEKGCDPTLYLSDEYVVSRFYDFKKLKKTIVCFDQIGRNCDDWSKVCTLIEDNEYSISTDRNSLEDFLKCSEIITKLWKWPYQTILDNIGNIFI